MYKVIRTLVHTRIHIGNLKLTPLVYKYICEPKLLQKVCEQKISL